MHDSTHTPLLTVYQPCELVPVRLLTHSATQCPDLLLSLKCDSSLDNILLNLSCAMVPTLLAALTVSKRCRHESNSSNTLTDNYTRELHY